MPPKNHSIFSYAGCNNRGRSSADSYSYSDYDYDVCTLILHTGTLRPVQVPERGRHSPSSSDAGGSGQVEPSLRTNEFKTLSPSVITGLITMAIVSTLCLWLVPPTVQNQLAPKVIATSK